MAGKDTYAGRSLAELAAALHGSKAEFVRRLEDPRRRWVGDWERDGGIATHKMAWGAADDGNAMVYPMVQEIDGELVDFTDPSVNGGDAGMGARSAVERGDYAVMTPEEADFFTRSYKGYYPKGDTFGDAAPDGYDIDFSQLAGTGGRTFNSRYLNYIMKSLLGRGVAPVQAAAILGTIAEESGGDPFAASESGEYNGLLQWGRDRYAPSLLSDGDPFAEIDRQLDHLCKTLGDTADGKSWTHGGEGSGYMTAADAQLDWAHPADLWHAVRSLNRGYVRPAGGELSALNRYGVADKAYALMRGRERRMKADRELEESAAKSKGVMADEAETPATWNPDAAAGTMLELPPLPRKTPASYAAGNEYGIGGWLSKHRARRAGRLMKKLKQVGTGDDEEWYGGEIEPAVATAKRLSGKERRARKAADEIAQRVIRANTMTMPGIDPETGVRVEEPLVPMDKELAYWTPASPALLAGDAIAAAANGQYGLAALNVGLLALPGGLKGILAKTKKTYKPFFANTNGFIKLDKDTQKKLLASFDDMPAYGEGSFEEAASDFIFDNKGTLADILGMPEKFKAEYDSMLGKLSERQKDFLRRNFDVNKTANLTPEIIYDEVTSVPDYYLPYLSKDLLRNDGQLYFHLKNDAGRFYTEAEIEKIPSEYRKAFLQNSTADKIRRDLTNRYAISDNVYDNIYSSYAGGHKSPYLTHWSDDVDKYVRQLHEAKKQFVKARTNYNLTRERPFNLAAEYGLTTDYNAIQRLPVTRFDDMFASDAYRNIYHMYPRYMNELLDMERAGMPIEDAIGRLLEQRFTFARGMSLPRGSQEYDKLITIPRKGESNGGRSDRNIFKDLGPNEDVGYMSNSLPTAFAYSYPNTDMTHIVGIIKRDPATFDLSGGYKQWLRNNTLEGNGIRIATSTERNSSLQNYLIDKIIDKKYLYDKKTGRYNSLADIYGDGVGGVLSKNNIKGIALHHDYISNELRRIFPDAIDAPSFNHFLIRGEVGTPYRNMYIDKLYDIPTYANFTDVFDGAVHAGDITRMHVGSPTKGFSQYSRGGRLYQDGGVFGGTFTPMVELPDSLDDFGHNIYSRQRIVDPIDKEKVLQVYGAQPDATSVAKPLMPYGVNGITTYDIDPPALPSWPLPAEHQTGQELYNDNVVNLIKDFLPLEGDINEHREGDRLYAYRVKVGDKKEAFYTIGSGLVLKDNPDVKDKFDSQIDEKGRHYITVEQNQQFWLDKYLNEALPRARRIVDAQCGDGTFDRLPDRWKAMFADYSFNLGNNFAQFENFIGATVAGDYDAMLREYERKANGLKLGTRNDYFHKYIEESRPKSPERKLYGYDAIRYGPYTEMLVNP